MILLPKPAHLVLKAPLGVVLPLAFNVSHQRAQICGPHGEQSIPALPRESGDTLLLHPNRRSCLDLRYHLCRGSRRRKPQGQMHMVLNASHSKTLAIKPARRAGQISMKGRANLVADQRLPLFRTEDNMDQVQAQRLCHDSLDVSGFQPSNIFTTRTRPRPSAWAVMFPGLRPSHAEVKHA